MYLDEGVFIKVSKELFPDLVPAPSLTICAVNSTSGAGWKNLVNSDTNSWFEAACGNNMEEEEFIDCILGSTFNAEDFMINVFDNQYKYQITFSFSGRCFTLQNRDQKIGSDIGKSTLSMHLNRAFDYKIFIHDANFFYYTLNPKALPGFRIDFKPETGMAFLGHIEIIQHRRIDRADHRCDKNDEYSFTDCVNAAILAHVGCGIPFNAYNVEFVNCTNIDQFTRHENFYKSIAAMEFDDVLTHTQCLAPCNFREIRQIGEPIPIRNGGTPEGFFFYSLSLVSTSLRTETEQFIYPFPNLVSDMGGCLGLFLGFSFFTIWDWVVTFFNQLEIFLK